MLQHSPSADQLTWYVGLIIAAAIGQAVFAFAQRSTVSRVSRFIEYELRNDAFRHLQTLDQRFYGEMHTGDLMARLTNDMNSVRQFVQMGAVNFMSTIIMLIVVAILMALINWKLALVAFAVLPFVSITMVVVSRTLQRRFRCGLASRCGGSRVEGGRASLRPGRRSGSPLRILRVPRRCHAPP